MGNASSATSGQGSGGQCWPCRHGFAAPARGPVRFDERLVNGMSVMARAVVEAKSFVGAARALDMTQPGVSRCHCPAREASWRSPVRSHHAGTSSDRRRPSFLRARGAPPGRPRGSCRHGRLQYDPRAWTFASSTSARCSRGACSALGLENSNASIRSSRSRSRRATGSAIWSPKASILPRASAIPGRRIWSRASSSTPAYTLLRRRPSSSASDVPRPLWNWRSGISPASTTAIRKAARPSSGCSCGGKTSST